MIFFNFNVLSGPNGTPFLPKMMNKDKCDTKEDPGKSMKDAVQWQGKRHLSG